MFSGPLFVDMLPIQRPLVLFQCRYGCMAELKEISCPDGICQLEICSIQGITFHSTSFSIFLDSVPAGMPYSITSFLQYPIIQGRVTHMVEVLRMSWKVPGSNPTGCSSEPNLDKRLKAIFASYIVKTNFLTQIYQSKDRASNEGVTSSVDKYLMIGMGWVTSLLPKQFKTLLFQFFYFWFGAGIKCLSLPWDTKLIFREKIFKQDQVKNGKGQPHQKH